MSFSVSVGKPPVHVIKPTVAEDDAILEQELAKKISHEITICPAISLQVTLLGQGDKTFAKVLVTKLIKPSKSVQMKFQFVEKLTFLKQCRYTQNQHVRCQSNRILCQKED